MNAASRSMRAAIEAVRTLAILMLPLTAYGAYRAYGDYLSQPNQAVTATPVQAVPLAAAPTRFSGQVLDLNLEEGLTFGMVRKLRKLMGSELDECVLYVPVDPTQRALLCLKREDAEAPHGIMMPLEFQIEQVATTEGVIDRTDKAPASSDIAASGEAASVQLAH